MSKKGGKLMMSTFLLLHRDDTLPADDKSVREETIELDRWTREIGNSVIDGGRPTTKVRTLGSTGSAQTQSDDQSDNQANTSSHDKPVTAYTIIEADSFEQAEELSKGAPKLSNGGRIDIYKIYDES